MDREKLEIAVNQYEEESIYGGMEALYDTKYAFKQGAEWLQSQSLADRLTEEEREKIKKIYSECELIDMDYNPNMPAYMNDAASAKMEVLISIFGKEMFEQ